MNFYHKTYGIDCISLRYANVYGPRQDYLGEAGVIAIFINKLLRNQKPIINGDGKQTRDFVYVEDVAEGVLTVFEKGKKGEAYNIGNNQPTTILELAQLAKEMTKSRSEIVKLGFGEKTRLKEREIEYRIPDISKMKALGWTPKTMIREGVKRILESMKN